MPHVLTCGDSSFGNLSNDAHLHLVSPVKVGEASSVLAACWSQTIVVTVDGSRKLLGLESPSLDLSARHWLGQDSFVAWLRQDSRVESLDGTLSALAFSHIVMNGRGELVGVSGNRVTFYQSLAALLSLSVSSAVVELSSPLLTASATIHSLVAGAGHFLLLLAAPSHAILAYGDNRFGQLGFNPSSRSSLEQLRHLDFFEGLSPHLIVAGAFHSAVVGGDGSLYMFGKDSEGQCGEEGGGEPTLVELGDHEEEVRSIGCGSGHTVVVTDRAVWVAGSNNAGQLGLGDFAPRSTFTRHDHLSTLSSGSTTVLCTRWGTLLNIDA